MTSDSDDEFEDEDEKLAAAKAAQQAAAKVEAGDEKAKLRRVLFDGEIGGLHFHVRFAHDVVVDPPGFTDLGRVEYFVNEHIVGETIYDRMLRTAHANATDTIAIALFPSDDGDSVADRLDAIHTVLHDELGTGDSFEGSFANQLLDKLSP